MTDFDKKYGRQALLNFIFGERTEKIEKERGSGPLSSLFFRNDVRSDNADVGSIDGKSIASLPCSCLSGLLDPNGIFTLLRLGAFPCFRHVSHLLCRMGWVR